ncbi:MAG: ABC transporter permease [Candidatus Krumholzibacteriia bacterium]
MSVRVLWQIIIKEIQQLRRDRRMVPMVLVAPLVQLVALGYAANRDVRDVPLLLVDQDRTAESRDLVDRFTASGRFVLVGEEPVTAGIDRWLEAGRADLALVIGAGFGDDVAGGRAPRVQVIADGSDAASAAVGLGYAGSIVAARGAELVRDRLAAAAREAAARGRPGLAAPRPPGRVTAEPRVWYNPDLKSRWFYIPAVLAMVLMVMTMILSSMAVAREKEIGTIEQISVTPIRPWQFIAGKLLPFYAIGFIDTLLVCGVMVGWFGVPMRGSFPLLVLLTMVFLLSTLGLGLMVSSFARTQQQAMMSASFLLMVPMIYLSGLLFPLENMPRAIRLVTYAVPLRYYAVILRGVILQGAGLKDLWRESLILLVFGFGVLGIASARFRKRLD